MSTRALRKLKISGNEVEKLEESDGQEEEEGEEQQAQVYVNKFNFLDEGDEVGGSDEEEKDEAVVVPTVKSTKQKNKPKKKKASKKDDGFRFVSDSDNPLFNENAAAAVVSNEEAQSAEPSINRSLLQIEAKYLNSENEMIRLFGAKVVNAEKTAHVRNHASSKRALLSKLTKHNTIVGRKSTWPEYRKNGLQMKVVKTSNDESEFAFEHVKEYQQVQFRFLDAVESLDHNNIMVVLHNSPFHIDSLIQLSDVSRMHDDTQTAADLIERALYSLQNTFHPTFNLQKNNFRFDYCRVENRGFFICLFKYLLYTGFKACYRTSLELCKLLLSMDIANDPLGVVLMIDFYALRSQNHKYLIEFYNHFNAPKHLSLLPNMQYSISLAYFHLYQDSKKTEHLNEANRHLKDALVKFPGLLLQLLDKCGIQPDKDVENSRIFAKHANLSTPAGLKYLFDLYSVRMNCEWKIGEVMVWLEKNVKEVVSEEKAVTSKMNEFKNKFKSLFAKIPTNILRHVLLSDSKEISMSLPPEYASKANYTFDPIPPKNSIVSYTRPERARGIAPYANETSLLTFFRSLLPTFNSEERVAEAAAAAAGGLPRVELGNIANQLREFLANMQPLENEEPLNPDDVPGGDDNIEEGHEFD